MKFIALEFSVSPIYNTPEARHTHGSDMCHRLEELLLNTVSLHYEHAYVTFRIFDENGVDEGPDDDV